jgi:hypothetical protein
MQVKRRCERFQRLLIATKTVLRRGQDASMQTRRPDYCSGVWFLLIRDSR